MKDLERENQRLRRAIADLTPDKLILKEAQIVIESWRRHTNSVRPHASLSYQPPAPEVFVPALAAWPAALPRPAPPAMLPGGAHISSELTFQPDHPMGADSPHPRGLAG